MAVSDVYDITTHWTQINVLKTTQDWSGWAMLLKICVSEHENMMHHVLLRCWSICSAPWNKHANTSKSLHGRDLGGKWRPLSVTLGNCHPQRKKRATSYQGCAAILKAATGLPEEIFKAGQLVARQVDDDGIFVRLSLKEMWSSGQQNSFVSSQWAGVCVQRHICLQLLL